MSAVVLMSFRFYRDHSVSVTKTVTKYATKLDWQSLPANYYLTFYFKTFYLKNFLS